MTADLITSVYVWIVGHSEQLVKIDVGVKISAFLFFTSLPFYSMDKELARLKSPLTFVWKLWFIEAVDFCTMVYGTIRYAHELFGEDDGGDDGRRLGDKHGDDGDDDGEYFGWDQWDTALRIFFLAFVVNATFFGGLSTYMFCKSLGTKRDARLGDGSYKFVAIFVSVLDGITDLPVWVASLTSRAYIGNLPLTFNIVINLLACVRGVYITMTAFIVEDEEAETDTEPPSNERSPLSEEGAENATSGGALDIFSPPTEMEMTPVEN